MLSAFLLCALSASLLQSVNPEVLAAERIRSAQKLLERIEREMDRIETWTLARSARAQVRKSAIRIKDASKEFIEAVSLRRIKREFFESFRDSVLAPKDFEITAVRNSYLDLEKTFEERDPNVLDVNLQRRYMEHAIRLWLAADLLLR